MNSNQNTIYSLIYKIKEISRFKLEI